jgi:hypothetical protein
MRVLQTYFPYYFKDKTDTDKKIMLAMWSEAFRNETDDKRFIRAIVRMCTELKFIPTIAEAREFYKRQALIDDMHERQGRLGGGIENLLLGTGGQEQ